MSLSRIRIRSNSAHSPATSSHSDPFHLVKAEFLAPVIIELGRARAGMVRHLRRSLQRATILEIRCDSRRPEAVIAELAM